MENKAKKNPYEQSYIDAFTKFDRVYTTKTTNCKEFIEYLKVYLKACSKPKCLILGRCSQFTSNYFYAFIEKCDGKHLQIMQGQTNNYKSNQSNYTNRC